MCYKLRVINENNELIHESHHHHYQIAWHKKRNQIVKECNNRGFLYKQRIYKNHEDYDKYKKFIKYFKYDKRFDSFDIRKSIDADKVIDAYFKRDDGSFSCQFLSNTCFEEH
eukprot:gene12799-7070_t